MTSAELVPLPGAQLVPPGWWQDVVVPWADEQTEAYRVRQAAATLAGLEAAWRQMDKDTLELTKARRYLEVRHGELLGEATIGRPPEKVTPESPLSDAEKQERHRLRRLASAKDRVMPLITSATNPDDLTRKNLLGLIKSGDTSKNLSTSTHNEWRTPARYIEAARTVLGAIDLDPASSAAANQTVRADRFYDEHDDGLAHEWKGRVWLNPPYGRQGEDFIRKLDAAYKSGAVEAAIVLVNAHGTDTGWFQVLWDYVLCFTDHRISFEASMRTAEIRSTFGNAFAYMGPDEAVFAGMFSQFGAIVSRWRP